MQARHAHNAFKTFAVERGITLSQLTAAAAVELMLAFYQAVRADDVDMNADGDMLLFQWGVYDWGHGASFTYNITRQLIFPRDDAQDVIVPAEQPEGDADDMVISQLSLTLNYAPTAMLHRLESGNRWCLHLGESTEFQDYIQGAAATHLVQRDIPVTVELRCDDVC